LYFLPILTRNGENKTVKPSILSKLTHWMNKKIVFFSEMVENAPHYQILSSLIKYQSISTSFI